MAHCWGDNGLFSGLLREEERGSNGLKGGRAEMMRKNDRNFEGEGEKGRKSKETRM